MGKKKPFKLSPERRNAIVYQGKKLVAGINSILGKDTCYLDTTIWSKTYLKFQKDNSHIMVYMKGSDLTFNPEYTKGFAKENVDTVSYALSKLYIIDNGEKKLNPHIATLTLNESKVDDITQQREQRESDIHRICSFIKEMRPLYTQWLNDKTIKKDGCYRLNGLLYKSRDYIQKLEQNDIPLSLINSSIEDVLKGKVQKNLPNKLKNILNDILTIMEYQFHLIEER